jgi:fucose permease
VLAFQDNARATVYPIIISDFQVNQTIGSLFFSAASATQLLATATGRRWLARLGVVRGLQVFLAIQAVGYELMAVANRGGNWSWLILILGAMLFGVSLGGLAIVQSILVVESAPPEMQRRAFSGLHGMYGSASLCAPLVTTALIRLGWTWSVCFAVSGVLPVILLLASMRWMGALHLHETPAKVTRLPWRHSWVAVMMALYVASEVAISSRLVIYVEDDLGRSPAFAAELLALFFACLSAGRLYFALVHVNVPVRRLLLFSAIGAALSFVLGLTVSPIFLGVCGLMMSLFFPMTMALVSEEYPLEIEGLTTLIMMANAFALILMHWGVGTLSDSFGLGRALSVGPLCLLVIVFILLVRRSPQA